MFRLFIVVCAATALLCGCDTISKIPPTAKGATIGAVAGGITGGAVTGGTGTLTGAAIGTGVGAVGGGFIGSFFEPKNPEPTMAPLEMIPPPVKTYRVKTYRAIPPPTAIQ